MQMRKFEAMRNQLMNGFARCRNEELQSQVDSFLKQGSLVCKEATSVLGKMPELSGVAELRQSVLDSVVKANFRVGDRVTVRLFNSFGDFKSK